MGDAPYWAWVTFGVTLAVLLAIDLFVHRGGRHTSWRAAVAWSVIWVGAGLAFGGFVGATLGREAAGAYFAAWLMEKSLSVDNLFVFVVIFDTLRIPERHQHTVLSWGIFGALVFRALFVGLGVAALDRFDAVAYVFGALLLVTAARVIQQDPAGQTENRIVAWFARVLPVTPELHGSRFLVRVDGRWFATPLLLAILGVEFTDIVFAIDSVPAAFAITRHPFLVYSSNAFAILGLRALYLVLAGTIRELEYLHYGLAGVLAFAGGKMLLERWIHVPPMASIAIIAALIGASVAASLRSRATRRDRPREAAPPRAPPAGRSPGSDPPPGPA